jgi:opacity protein-like surface antigen
LRQPAPLPETPLGQAEEPCRELRDEHKEGRIMIGRTGVLASLLALVASASWAQDPRVEIGALFGWTFSDGVSGDAFLAPDGNRYNHIEPEDGTSFFLDIGFFLSDHVQLGALFDRQSSEMAISGQVDRKLGDWTIDNYHGVFTFNFGDHPSKAWPYIFGGAGVTHYGSVSFTDVAGLTREIDEKWQFSTTWGAGVKVYLGEHVGLRLGGRWTPAYVKSDAVGWWCDPYWGCYVEENAQFSNQFEFAGGLSLRF